MARTSKKVVQAIDKLAQVRATLRGLKRSSEVACKTIKAAGGGQSRKWIALIREVPARVYEHQARTAVELKRRKGGKRK